LVLARFLISGVLNTGITYLLYLWFLQLFSYRAAYTGAFVLGILISYCLNALFVFRVRIAVRSLIRFPLIYLFQYLLGMLLVVALIEYAGFAPWAAPLFAILITVPLTYVLSKSIFSSEK
jgi:putative flippase GtrA